MRRGNFHRGGQSKGRVLPFDDSVHRAADRLLPWFVNGTLEGEELAQVERHVSECTQCQHEIQRLRELREAVAQAQPVAELPRPLRLPASPVPPTRAWRGLPAWARWALVAQFALIIVLALSMLPDFVPDHRYHSLGAINVPAETRGNVVVVFDRRIAEAELRRVLRDTGAVAIDPPTRDGAYVLHIPAGSAPAAIDRLRKESAVVLVERLVPEATE